MLEKINQDFAEIHKAIESGNLSDNALESVFDFSKKVELEGYKAKFAIELEVLFETSPSLTSKIVLERILTALPVDITPSFLPVLAAFVVEKWEVLTYRKSAA